VKLLTTDEIREGLDRRFLHMEPAITGLRLLSDGLSEDEVQTIEQCLGVKLPVSFRAAVEKYCFGKLTIGPVGFCSTGDYSAVLERLNSEVHWWGAGARPRTVIMIATSDPFGILLNVANGEVFAMDRERSWSDAIKVATDFNLFLRGIGTAILERTGVNDLEALGQFIATQVKGESSYWVALVK